MKVLCVPRWMLGITVNQLDMGSICKKYCVCVCSGGEERYNANHTVDLKNSRYEQWYDKKIKVL